MDDGKGAGEFFTLELDGDEEALFEFLSNGCVGNNGDTSIDFDSAFDRFDVIELHNGFDIDFRFAENLIGGFSGWDIGIEPDKFFAFEVFDFNRFFVGEFMGGIADEDEIVLKEIDDFELSGFDGEGDQANIDGVLEDVFVNQIGTPVFHPDIDGRVFFEESGDVGRELV